MVDTLPRPEVSPQRYRDLEMCAWQVMMLAHATCQDNQGELLIVRDICTNIMRRWMADERLFKHEVAARQGVPLMAERDGNIIHLRPTATD